MQYQPSEERMPERHDAEQVVHLALETTGWEREVGQRGDLGSAAVDLHH
jgi:hypothetical protein